MYPLALSLQPSIANIAKRGGDFIQIGQELVIPGLEGISGVLETETTGGLERSARPAYGRAKGQAVS